MAERRAERFLQEGPNRKADFHGECRKEKDGRVMWKSSEGEGGKPAFIRAGGRR